MAGYTTRQSTYTDGDVIDAADSNDEFDAILAAFGAASGHAHDGSAGEGSRITVVGTASDNVTFGTALTPDANGTIDIGTSGAQFKDLYIDGVGYIDGLQLTSGATVSTILDEDTMSSDSATALATQQSIKAYVDSQVTAQDLDLTSDSGTIAIDLDSETLTVAGGTGIDTSASTNTLTVAIDSTVATLAGSQTLTNKTLTAPVIGTISNTGTLTLPTSTDTLVGRATTDTLTNKTLTSPVISTISNTGTLTLPTSTDTLVGKATTDTLTNKTINLGSNTVTGTTAQFNAALSDGDFATKAGTETLTNKTVDLTSNTLTGTTAQFNTALSDGDFATLAGTETLTNKTVNLASNTLTGTTAQFNTALSDGSFATLAGAETLTNKTVNLTSNTLTGTTAQFNTALSDGDFATLAGTETLTNKTLTSPTVTSPALNTSVSGTAVLDDDTFATASATTLATSESIKAYVDSLTGGTATLAGLTDTNITTPADGAVLFYDTATSKWIDNVVSGDITIADTGVATLASSVTITTPDIDGGTVDNAVIGGATPAAGTFTNLTASGTVNLSGATVSDAGSITTADINGGTIDGTVIGGTTAAAGSFTSVSATGNITVDGTVDGRDVAADGTKLDGIESGATADQTGAEIASAISGETVAALTITDVNTTSINGGQIGGRRNMLYNGAMQVAQRGTSFASTSAPTYTLDRWYWNSQAEDVVTVEKSSDHPKGSGSSIKVTVTTADASTTDDYADIEQRIEGLDLQHLLYGTADAKSLTLSFWVKSSQTGDMAVGLYIPDDGRNIGSTVTISSASTWEYKTVTFAGDTTGVIDNDSGEGLRVWMHLLAGSDFTSVDNTSWGTYAGNRKAYGQTLNVIGTTSATFQLADVQLEVGSVATEFEHRSYGEELALCQRYYQNPSTIQNIFSGYVATGNVYYHSSTFPVQMRANPTMTYTIYATPSGFALTAPGGIATPFGQYAYKTSTSTQNAGYYTYKYTADAEL
jgi:hypothetical protein